MNLQNLILEDFNSIKTGLSGSKFDIQVDSKDLRYTVTMFPDEPTQGFLTIEDKITRSSRQASFKIENEEYEEIMENLDCEIKSSVISFFNEMFDLSCEEKADVIFVEYS